MKRAEKTTMIEELTGLFQSNSHVILTSFAGLSANQANDLRQRVRRAGGSYAVLKNRLAKRAATGTAVERIVDKLKGPCAVALHDADPVLLAKTLTDFSKENPQLAVLAGVVDARDVVDATGVKRLASLPGLQELRAQLLALCQTPATQLVRLIGTPAGQVARVIDARREKLEGNEG